MSARDDYPQMHGLVGNFIHNNAGIAAADGHEILTALDEIDRLRNANKLYREILDDVLPTIAVKDGSFFKIDEHWIRIVLTSSFNGEPIQIETTLLT